MFVSYFVQSTCAVNDFGFYCRETTMKYPANRQWSHEPEVVYDATYRVETPMFSIVMPIHNQGAIIYDVITKIFIHTCGLYDVFLILDGCTDNTRSEVLRAIETRPAELCRLTIVSNPEGVFETSCDNLGFVNARGTYIVEIQADMLIQTSNYNGLLATPLEIYPDLIAVSGRCCHTLSSPIQGVGKLGSKVEEPHNVGFDRYNQIFLSHTVNRGPLVLRTSMLKELGYLDEPNFVLENDEHDLFYRAWTQKKWRTAFYPVEVYSPLSWGTTRKPRPAHVQAYLNSRRQKVLSINANTLPPASEVRALSNEGQFRAHQRLRHSTSL